MSQVIITNRGVTVRTLPFRTADDAIFYARSFQMLCAGDGTWDSVEVIDADGLIAYIGVVMHQ